MLKYVYWKVNKRNDPSLNLLNVSYHRGSTIPNGRKLYYVYPANHGPNVLQKRFWNIRIALKSSVPHRARQRITLWTGWLAQRRTLGEGFWPSHFHCFLLFCFDGPWRRSALSDESWKCLKNHLPPPPMDLSSEAFLHTWGCGKFLKKWRCRGKWINFKQTIFLKVR